MAALMASIVTGFSVVEREIDERNVDRRHAHGQAVELALERRNDLAQRLGGARRARDHAHGRGARAAQVALAVREVEQALVVRVRVDRRHETLLDAEVVEHDLGDRCEAVRRARAVRDDVVLRAVVLVVVHAHDERDVVVLRGRADDDLAGAGGEVRCRLLLVGEEARALEHDVDALRLPRQLLRILERADRDFLAADDERLFGMAHGRGREAAVNRVVLEQVRERFRVGEIVDADHLESVDLALMESAEHAATDATEAIDADFRCHDDVAGT